MGVLAGAAGGVYWWLYEQPRAGLAEQLGHQLEVNAAFEKQLTDRQQVAEGLKAIAATTLGAKADEVDATFRSKLGEIAEKGCGLAGVQVTTQKPADVANPAGTAAKLTKPAGLRSTLRKQHDFAVITGVVEGHGTLEQALKAAAAIQAQPWVHRVDSFSIRPEGRDRDRFELKLGVATILLLPPLAPKNVPEPRIVGAPETSMSELAAIVAKNVFKEPAAMAAQAPPAAPAPGPPAPPYNDWRLTGVVESRLGTEAFLVNVKTQQRMTLAVGAAVADARFVSGAGERAVFEIAGQHFEVSNGQTLEQRRPVTR
jgi:hypothetical protein